jgi:hypothetical protein
MSRSAANILEDARQLPPDDLAWVVQNLLQEEVGEARENIHAVWRKDLGEPKSGYEDWFRAGLVEALTDESQDIPYDEAMKHFHHAISEARKLKAAA